MTSVVFPVVGGRIARTTVLDSCGRPAYGDRAQIASEGLVSVAQTANYDDGSDKTVTNFGGRKCVFVKAKAELTDVGIDVTFCAMDPDYYTALTGFPREVDPVTGNTVGYRIDRDVLPSDVSIALELWTDAGGTIGCDDEGGETYGYLLWPFMTGGRVGDYTIEDNAVTFQVTGLTSKDGSQWGIGPYNVITDAAGQPSGLLRAIGPKEPFLQRLTSVPPPEETAGLVPLDDPDEPDATGATAGIPGVFTPEGSVRPFDLEALIDADLDASPSTAWTTGQHVILGDGSYANWSGTAWESGKA